MLTRRPTLIAVAATAALLIPAALAPAAQAGTQVRQFEAFGITLEGPGANSPRIGDIALNFVFKNKRAGGKYTPRRLTRVRFSEVPLQLPGARQPLLADRPAHGRPGDGRQGRQGEAAPRGQPEAEPLRLPLRVGFRRLRDRVLQRHD